MKYRLRGDILAGLIRTKHGNSPSNSWYRLSKWALRRLAEKNPIEADAIHEAIKTAGIAMNLEKAMFQNRPVASPLQPRISDLVDLVLALDETDAQWSVHKLRRMSWALKEHVRRRDIQAQATEDGATNLSNFSYAFTVLLSGAARAIREGEVESLRRHMKQEDLRFFLERATSPDFVGALYGQSNEHYDERSGGFVRKVEEAYA